MLGFGQLGTRGDKKLKALSSFLREGLSVSISPFTDRMVV
jgi:hypothetical protein